MNARMVNKHSVGGVGWMKNHSVTGSGIDEKSVSKETGLMTKSHCSAV